MPGDGEIVDVCHAALVRHGRLAAEYRNSNRQFAETGCDRGEASGGVIAGPADQTHPPMLDCADDAVAIVLDLMEPAGPGRRLLRGPAKLRCDLWRTNKSRPMQWIPFYGRAQHRAR